MEVAILCIYHSFLHHIHLFSLLSAEVMQSISGTSFCHMCIVHLGQLSHRQQLKALCDAST